jgi:hypothetical protein
MPTRQAQIGGFDKAMTPLPQPGPWEDLISSQTLTASFQGAVSGVVGVGDARKLNLWIAYDGVESQTAGEPQIRVMLSAKPGDAPAVGDDVWFAPGAFDSSPTDAVLTATAPTGADYSLTPEWREFKVTPLVLNTFPLDNATDKIRVCAQLDVSHAIWLYAAAAEVGDTSHCGVLHVRYSLSV